MCICLTKKCMCPCNRINLSGGDYYSHHTTVLLLPVGRPSFRSGDDDDDDDDRGDSDGDNQNEKKQPTDDDE